MLTERKKPRRMTCPQSQNCDYASVCYHGKKHVVVLPCDKGPGCFVNDTDPDACPNCTEIKKEVTNAD